MRAAAQLRCGFQPAHHCVPRGCGGGARQLPGAGRRDRGVRARAHHRHHRGSPALDPALQRFLAARGRSAAALLREYRRPHAETRAGQAPRAVPGRPAVSDVRPDRGIPFHLPASGRSRPAPRLHRQGRAERPHSRGTPGRHSLRCGRNRRTGACRGLRGAGLLARSGAHRATLPAFPEARPWPGMVPEQAVWSGDLVRRDSEGFCTSWAATTA